jgi:hypothetical protein
LVILLSRMKRLPPLRRTRQVYQSTSVAQECTSSYLLTQIDVAVNAPESGFIREFFANEEDTVVVGQDLARLEPSSEGGSAQKEDSGTKEPAPSKESTSSEPEPPKKEESQPKDQSSPPPPPPQESKPAPKKETPPKQPEPSKAESKPSSSTSALGSREERRVCDLKFCGRTTVANGYHRSR